MSKEVSGKLSSRVLNMKFMRQAEHAEEVAKEQQTARQFVDSSEWTLADREKITSKLRSQPPTMGHTGLRAGENTDLDVTSRGRRTFGQKSEPESKPAPEETLEELWEAQKLENPEKHSSSGKRTSPGKDAAKQEVPNKRPKGPKTSLSHEKNQN